MSPESKMILYVDDDQDDIAMFKEAIKEINAAYSIIAAFDGVHAMELLGQMLQKDELPCLIVLDINMPRMDGKQTLIEIQKSEVFSTIPTVLFSTSTSQLDKSFCEA